MAIDYGTIIDAASRSDSVNTSGLPIDMEAQTALLDPNSYVFEAITRQIGKKLACNQMKHEYRERRVIPAFGTLTAAVTVGASTLTMANDYTRVKNDYLLYIPYSGEMLLVQDASIDSTVSVVRASSGTGTIQNAVPNGQKVMILGEAHAEGEEVPAAVSVQSINKYNYIMQKDRRVQVTDINEAIEHYDQSEQLAMDRKQAFIEYKRDVNLLMYVGVGSREVTSASGPRRHVCSGLIERLTENNVDLSGAGAGLTIETCGLLMHDTKYRGASSEGKILIVGTNGAQAISAWGLNALRVSPMEKQWGLRINTIKTAFGDLEVVFDPALNADYNLADRGFVIDKQHIRQMFLRTLDVRMYLNIPNLSSLHSTVDAISGTFGLQVKFEELHGAITGIK
jgi:hypothetical protein